MNGAADACVSEPVLLVMRCWRSYLDLPRLTVSLSTQERRTRRTFRGAESQIAVAENAQSAIIRAKAGA
jgi:hypothetical protein